MDNLDSLVSLRVVLNIFINKIISHNLRKNVLSELEKACALSKLQKLIISC